MMAILYSTETVLFISHSQYGNGCSIMSLIWSGTSLQLIYKATNSRYVVEVIEVT